MTLRALNRHSRPSSGVRSMRDVCCDLELIELVSKMESIVSSCGPELGVLFGVTI